jgi:hypothetical protein
MMYLGISLGCVFCMGAYHCAYKGYIVGSTICFVAMVNSLWWGISNSLAGNS